MGRNTNLKMVILLLKYILWTALITPERPFVEGHSHGGEHVSVCEDQHNDLCGCRQAGCEYDTVSGLCNDGHEVCRDAVHSPDVPVCIRENVWYSTGGMLCQFLTPAPDACEIEEVLLAVNFGGEDVLGDRNIPYQADNDVPRYVVAEERYYERNSSATLTAMEVATGDEPLFHSIVTGRGKERCDTYKVPLEQDGPHEFSVKLKDGCWKEPGKRYFTVKLAGLAVFPEVDIIRYAEHIDHVLDLSVNFNVEDGYLTAPGFDPVEIPYDEHSDTNMVTVEFCSSECQVIDDQFIAAAFSVVRFEPAPPPPPPSPTTTTTVDEWACTEEDEKLEITKPVPGSNIQFISCLCQPGPSPKVCRWTVESCADGYIYDPDLGHCVAIPTPSTPDELQCTEEDEKLEITKPVPGTNNQYIYCLCKPGPSPKVCRWTVESCPDGWIYDPDLGHCVEIPTTTLPPPPPPTPPPTPPTTTPPPPPPPPPPPLRPACNILYWRRRWPWPGVNSCYAYCACLGICWWEFRCCTMGQKYHHPTESCIWALG